MSEFFAMDGYAAYIWPAYALTFLGIVVLTVMMIRSRARAQARLKQLSEETH